MQYEKLPPNSTYVGRCDQGFAGVAVVNSVDWGKPVLQRPSEAKDLESVPLETIDLRYDTIQRPFTR